MKKIDQNFVLTENENILNEHKKIFFSKIVKIKESVKI